LAKRAALLEAVVELQAGFRVCAIQQNVRMGKPKASDAPNRPTPGEMRAWHGNSSGGCRPLYGKSGQKRGACHKLT
jgi:hypothetical protein